MGQSRRMTATLGGGTPVALRVLLRIVRNIRVGTLRVVAPDGTSYMFRGTRPGPDATLIVRHLDMVRRTVLGGDLGLAEAWLDGQWDTPDLFALLELGQRNMQAFRELKRARWLTRAVNALIHALRRNTRRGARRNIRYHYDLGNDFYKLWLDETLTYSCAVFARPDQPLGEAQRNKCRLLLERLQLGPQHHLLEIGSGWGGFALHAARETGCRVTGITLSEEQLKEARTRAIDAGVHDRVHFELVDYRDVTGRYDRIVSIEMFEAVGERYWEAFFRAVHDRLAPGGRAALQVITLHDEAFRDYRRGVDFIQRYVFPGGMLPSPSVWESCVRQAGLRTESSDFHGLHYARTLRAWDARVRMAHHAITQLGFDERFLRMWHYYLAYCHAGFITGHVDVMQTTLVHSA